MTDTREKLRAARDRFEPPHDVLEALHRRRERRDRVRRRTTVAVSLTLFLGLVAGLAISVRTAGRPAVEPEPTVTTAPSPKGIFSSVGGWIAFEVMAARSGRSRRTVPSRRSCSTDGRTCGSRTGRRTGLGFSWNLTGGVALTGDLAVIEPDGSETTLVRFGDDDQFDGASFSPDGATVVYARWARGDRNQLLTVASDGSGKPRLLLESRGSMLYEPTYSPDGTRIAYVDGGGDHSHTIRVVNADGTDVRVLIDATGPFDAVGHIRGLEWSPDGSLIAVDLRAVGDNPEGGIYTVRPDGTDLRLLIPGAGNPAWSPDGSLIAYSPYSADLNHDGVWGVWVANADGSDPRMLSPRRVRRPLEPRRSCRSGLISMEDAPGRSPGGVSTVSVKRLRASRRR